MLCEQRLDTGIHEISDFQTVLVEKPALSDAYGFSFKKAGQVVGVRLWTPGRTPGSTALFLQDFSGPLKCAVYFVTKEEGTILEFIYSMPLSIS